MKKSKNTEFENAKFIVGKFAKNYYSIDWARELKIAKQLLNKYNKIEFWECLDLGFKLNSLAYFFTEDGSAKLKTEFNKYNLTIPAKIEYIIDKQKYGEDISFEKKTENVIEFLN